MPDIDDLVKDFAYQRISTEAPYDFHKIDIEDVIQVYMDLFGTDPADDIVGMNKGGMMNINRMTAPLGYALGGPAGMVGRPTSAPESYEGFEPIHTGYAEAIANMNNPEYANKWNMTRPRQPGLDEQLMQDYEPPIPRWGKAKDLGKKKHLKVLKD